MYCNNGNYVLFICEELNISLTSTDDECKTEEQTQQAPCDQGAWIVENVVYYINTCNFTLLIHVLCIIYKYLCHVFHRRSSLLSDKIR